MEKIAIALVSQVTRAILIGTLPYLVSLLMGYRIEYWHFLVLAYLVDTGGQLINKIIAGFVKNQTRIVKNDH